MWEKIPIEDAIHLRSHSISLNEVKNVYTTSSVYYSFVVFRYLAPIQMLVTSLPSCFLALLLLGWFESLGSKRNRALQIGLFVLKCWAANVNDVCTDVCI